MENLKQKIQLAQMLLLDGPGMDHLRLELDMLLVHLHCPITSVHQ